MLIKGGGYEETVDRRGASVPDACFDEQMSTVKRYARLPSDGRRWLSIDGYRGCDSQSKWHNQVAVVLMVLIERWS